MSSFSTRTATVLNHNLIISVFFQSSWRGFHPAVWNFMQIRCLESRVNGCSDSLEDSDVRKHVICFSQSGDVTTRHRKQNPCISFRLRHWLPIDVDECLWGMICDGCWWSVHGRGGGGSCGCEKAGRGRCSNLPSWNHRSEASPLNLPPFHSETCWFVSGSISKKPSWIFF